MPARPLAKAGISGVGGRARTSGGALGGFRGDGHRLPGIPVRRHRRAHPTARSARALWFTDSGFRVATAAGHPQGLILILSRPGRDASAKAANRMDMPDQLSGVRLPILHDVAVRGYELYPGQDGNGLHAAVHPGVNLLVGINGLGKTTLLSALFRAFSGPRDWKKRKLDRLAGTTSTELGVWTDRNFFSDRVPDRARAATIRIQFELGGAAVSLERRLQTLDVTHFSIDGRRLPNDNDLYEKRVAELAGLDSFEDFFLLLRYLIFYLEGRQNVIWDPTAQSDLLRVLFYDAVLSGQIRRDSAEVQRLDSLVRNRTYALKPLRSRAETLRKAAAQETSVKHELDALQARLAGVTDAERRTALELEKVETEYRRERLRLEREKIELAEVQRRYEYEERQYFAQLFPELSETVQYLLLHLASGGGCLVCGSRSAAATEHVRDTLRDGTCPVCTSPPRAQEQVISAEAVSRKRLEKLHEELRERKESVQAQQSAADALAASRIQLHKERWEARTERETISEEYKQLTGALPPDQEQLARLEDVIRSEEGSIRTLNRQRRELSSSLEELLGQGERRVNLIAEHVSARFQQYATIFLAQECRLEYTLERRALGQLGSNFPFPRFTPSLASGGFGHTPQPRFEASDVSESQKEFIDLAFRMALMAVAGQERPGLLVIETPEASLDATFILRAGHMLGEFARASGNRLLASSNLNQTHMIPVLFGVFRRYEQDMLVTANNHYVPPEDRARRVINLIEIAKENAALKQFHPQITEEYERALFPEKFQPDEFPSAE